MIASKTLIVPYQLTPLESSAAEHDLMSGRHEAFGGCFQEAVCCFLQTPTESVVGSLSETEQMSLIIMGWDKSFIVASNPGHK